MTQFRIFLAIILFALTFTFSARAEISDALVLNAQKSIDAFTCSAVASIAGDEDFSQRLFSVGYTQGRIFLAAVNGNIAASDLGSKIPQAYAAARGPNVDFALGRVYQENMARTKAYFNQRPNEDPAKSRADAVGKFEELKCGELRGNAPQKTK